MNNEMMKKINDYVVQNHIDKYNHHYTMIAPKIKCKDGLELSVQASAGHYCHPRDNYATQYTEFEIGFPTMIIPELEDYAEEWDKHCDTVYSYVPLKLIAEIVLKHGGMIE